MAALTIAGGVVKRGRCSHLLQCSLVTARSIAQAGNPGDSPPSGAFMQWAPGQNQPLPFEPQSWKEFTPSELTHPGALYSLYISSIVPRPIALVSSQSAEGTVNCAPFSYFSGVCHDPPLISIGFSMAGRGKAKVKKDTLNNIESTGQFVVNLMSSWYLESANHTSGNFPPQENEMDLAGLTPVPSSLVRPPRVGEAAVQMECEMYHTKDITNDQGVHTATLVLGRIVKFHIHEQVLTQDSTSERPKVCWSKLAPVARLGGDLYTEVNNARELPRPRVK